MPNIELTWQGIKECEVFWFESTPICMHPREKSLNFHNLDSITVGLNYDVGLWNELAKLTIKSSLNEVCYYEVLFNLVPRHLKIMFFCWNLQSIHQIIIVRKKADPPKYIENIFWNQLELLKIHIKSVKMLSNFSFLSQVCFVM